MSVFGSIAMLEELYSIVPLKQFDYGWNNLKQTLILEFGSNEGLGFENVKVQSTLGSNGTKSISNHVFFIGYDTANTAALLTDT